MTQFGETVEGILEFLSEKEKRNVDELEKKIPSGHKALFDFLKEYGLIEMENGTVRITDFGSAILTEE